jgi:hypothetical protein
MKKTTSLILVLLFSALMLVGEAINAAAEAANLCCNDLSACCSTECCSGPGTPTGCTIDCQDETRIECPKKTKQSPC